MRVCVDERSPNFDNDGMSEDPSLYILWDIYSIKSAKNETHYLIRTLKQAHQTLIP